MSVSRSGDSGRYKICARFIVALLFTLLLQANAQAGLLLAIDPVPNPVAAGGSVILTGTITNTTGHALQATDLFLNFSAFDPAVIAQVDQLLGNPDFALPNNTFKSGVDLFRATLLAGAGAGTTGISVSLEDVFNDSSGTVVANINVTAGAVPEPSTLAMFAGLAIVLLAYKGALGLRGRPRFNHWNAPTWKGGD